VVKKEARMFLKYKDLTIQTQHMWNVKAEGISVLIRGTVTISKLFRKYLNNMPGKHNISELQKTAILGIGHCKHIGTLKSTNMKVQNVYHGK
jgi:hypothetical protein